MRYPLENWKILPRGYTFGVPTSYSNFHLGIDLTCPTGTPVYAPCDGVVNTMVGQQGGNTIHLKTPTHLIRFLHLSQFLKTGPVKEGDLIAKTGNTGLSTGSHLHTDISKGALDLNNTNNFIDPEIFYKPDDVVNRIVTKLYTSWLINDPSGIAYWSNLVKDLPTLEQVVDARIADIKKTINK